MNNTLCIDTGCVFGGKLTALRWPEKQIVSVPAAKVYYEPSRPLVPAPELRSAQAESDDILDMADVSGRRWIDTELRGRIVVAEENAAAALEVMSRFALPPQWLVYLPPTMSPSETSSREGWLERPEEAFEYFRKNGVNEVVCEEKHMGSRANIAICRNAVVARERFGVVGDETGAIWTRTGRAFFSDKNMTEEVLTRLRAAVDRAALWEELATDWLLLDAEIMPWSAKAGALIENQYAPVAFSSHAGFVAANDALSRAAARGVPIEALRDRFVDRAQRAEAYSVHGHLMYGRSPVSTICASHRSIFLRAKAMSGSTTIMFGIWNWRTGSVVMRLPQRRGGDRWISPTSPQRLRHQLVGRANSEWRRRHGGEAACVCSGRSKGSSATSLESTWPRVSAHHLWARI